MIVRQREDSLEIVHQSAHAHLASRLAGLWQAQVPHLDWPQLLLATLHHDHGWIENELAGDLLDEKPRHFLNIDLDRAVDICQSSVDTAFCVSSACGVLVSRHVEYLYGGKPHRGLQRAARGWKQRRVKAMKALGADEHWLEDHYSMILWADTVSLIICCQQSGFTGALTNGLQEQGQTFERVDDTQFTLTPWPFREKSYRLSYEYHTLKKESYQSAAELREVLLRSVGCSQEITLRQTD